MVVARSESKTDQRARIRHRLRLPTVVGLIAPHGIFAGLIPRSCRCTAQVVLADQSCLDRLGALGINLLLASHCFSSSRLPVLGLGLAPMRRLSGTQWL